MSTTARHVWHVWPEGRNWPALPEDEQQFCHDLAVTAGEDVPGPPQRWHHTAILGALRCGLSAAQMLTNLPGMRAADALAAYVHLERRRTESLLAWEEIVEDPTVTTLAENSSAASLLLPVPLARVSAAAGRLRSGAAFAAFVHSVSAQIQHTATATRSIEDLLRSHAQHQAPCVEAGLRLHHPWDPGLWSSPYYLADRVTALSATRVADLLHERTDQES